MRRKQIDSRWSISYPKAVPDSCILALPGRCNHGQLLVGYYSTMNFPSTLIVGVTPNKTEWYPMPNGANDQKRAVEGQLKAARAIDRVVDQIEEYFSIPRSKIALTGFSAGGVMALYTAAVVEKPVAAAISHSGAILDTKNFPKVREHCKVTPFLIQHNQDDKSFSWDERYVPMKNCLVSNGYKTKWIERPFGGHNVWIDDMLLAGMFLENIFGHKDFAATNIEGIKKSLSRVSCRL